MFGLIIWRGLVELFGVVGGRLSVSAAHRHARYRVHQWHRSSTTPNSATRVRHLIRPFTGSPLSARSHSVGQGWLTHGGDQHRRPCTNAGAVTSMSCAPLSPSNYLAAPSRVRRAPQRTRVFERWQIRRIPRDKFPSTPGLRHGTLARTANFVRDTPTAPRRDGGSAPNGDAPPATGGMPPHEI